MRVEVFRGGSSHAAQPEDLDVSDATFVRPDLTTFCRLDELGLVVVGQHLEPDRAVLACRVAVDPDDPEEGEADRWCRRCGGGGGRAGGAGAAAGGPPHGTACPGGWRRSRSDGDPRRCWSSSAATGAV